MMRAHRTWHFRIWLLLAVLLAGGWFAALRARVATQEQAVRPAGQPESAVRRPASDDAAALTPGSRP